MIITRLLMPPPPIPAIARRTNSCTAVCAKPHPRSPTAINVRLINNRFLRPKISDRRPLINWNAVDAIRNDVPIHDVAVPVLRSTAMAGVAVETLVWSMKETKRQTDRAGIAIRSCVGVMVFLWPPMDAASLSSSSSTCSMVGEGDGVCWSLVGVPGWYGSSSSNGFSGRVLSVHVSFFSLRWCVETISSTAVCWSLIVIFS
jgi:hypothetical protein